MNRWRGALTIVTLTFLMAMASGPFMLARTLFSGRPRAAASSAIVIIDFWFVRFAAYFTSRRIDLPRCGQNPSPNLGARHAGGEAGTGSTVVTASEPLASIWLRMARATWTSRGSA